MYDENKNTNTVTKAPPTANSGIASMFSAPPPATPLTPDDLLSNPPATPTPVLPPQPPAMTEETAHHIPKPSGRAWKLMTALIVILAGATVLILRHPSSSPPVNSQASQTPQTNQLGDLSEQSVTFSIDTKIAKGKTLTATGPVIIQNTADSTSALQVQNAAGSNLLVADTANNVVGIGTTPVAGGARLQVGGNISASGSISANGGATTLSNNGLTINNVLICTSSGCKNLAAQAASGQVFTGDAVTLNGQPGSYYRNASNINSGTLADTRLSSNVALLNRGQTFTGINAFTAAGNTFVGDGSGLSAVNAATLGGQAGSYYTNASNINSGTLSDSRLSTNITKQGNAFNGASQLVMLDSSGLLPALDGSALTNLNASQVNIGTIADNRLSTNVTLAGNMFNGANQLVQLNNSGDLPALSGINLTNLDAGAVSTGTLNDLRLSPNVTLQGNTFNGASQLIQTTSQSYFPALNGSLITNLTAGNITSGTLSDSRLSSNVALLGALSQTFSGNNTFSNIITAPGLETTNSGHAITLGFSGVATGNVAYNFDVAAAPGTYNICTSAGNCAGAGGGVTTAGGTVNQLAKFNGTQTLADSIISDDGSTVTIGGNLAAGSITQNTNEVCDVSGNCAGVGGQVGGSGTSGKIALFSGTSTIGDSIISQASTTVSVAGNLNITGQYQLNGTQISSAALSDASSIAMLDGSQTFSGNNLFTGGLQLQPASDSTTALLVTNHLGNNNVLIVDTTNGRVGINTQPGYALDVAGDINISTGSAFRINGVAICGPSATCAPSSGSASYIQNSVSQQANANINIQSVNSGSIVGNFEGAVGQTADLIRAQDGSGANVFHVDPSGNVNITGQYQINGSPICTSGGCVAQGGSASYIQNGTSPQTADFDITGTGITGKIIVGYSALGSGIAGFNGSVGIGTSNPGSYKLSVAGDTLIKSGSSSAFQVQDSGGNSVFNVDTTSGLVNLGVGNGGNSNKGIALNMVVSSAVNANSIVIIDPLDPGEVTITSTENIGTVFGITTKAAAANVAQPVVTSGSYQVMADSAQVNVGDMLVTSSTSGDATVTTSPNVGAVLGRAMSSKAAGAPGLVWVSLAPGTGSGDYTPVGTISAYSGGTIPSGWLSADGSSLLRSAYSGLYNALVTSKGATTVTIASPGVFSLTNHGLTVGDKVFLETSGSLPSGLSTDTTYCVATVPNANTFTLGIYTQSTQSCSTTPINTSGTQSGIHNLYFAPYGVADSTHFYIPDLRGRAIVGLNTAETGRSDVNALGNNENVAIGSRTSYHKSTASANSVSTSTSNSTSTSTVTGPAAGSAVVYSGAGSGFASCTNSCGSNYPTGGFGVSTTTNTTTTTTTNTTVTVGPQSNVPTDTGAYLTTNYIIKSGASITLTAANNYIQNSTSTQIANINIQSTGAGNIAAVFQGTTGQTADILDVKDSSNSVLFSVGPDGSVGIGTTGAGQKLNVNGSIRIASGYFMSFGATDDMRIQDAGSNELDIYTNGVLQLSLDSSGNLSLGGNGLLVLGVKTTDPGCATGGLYYNSSSQSFRGCVNGTWNDFMMGNGVPAGTISSFAGSSAPVGYLMADGSAVSRTTYAALFAVIGTTYGAGNGSTTFNLPDLRGRDAIGLDGGTGRASAVTALGATGGEASHTQTLAQLPVHNLSITGSPQLTGSVALTGSIYFNDPGHTHTYTAPTGSSGGFGGSTSTPSGMGAATTSRDYTGITVNNGTLAATNGTLSVNAGTLSTSSVGSGQAFNVLDPYIGLNYIIKY